MSREDKVMVFEFSILFVNNQKPKTEKIFTVNFKFLKLFKLFDLQCIIYYECAQLLKNYE